MTDDSQPTKLPIAQNESLAEKLLRLRIIMLGETDRVDPAQNTRHQFYLRF